MRRRFTETLMSIGALGLLFFGLVAFDDRVREQVWMRLSSDPAAQLSTAGHQVRDLTDVILIAARDQSIDHAPMMIFVVAGVVLFMFMLRT